jgi:hypothetical protein
MKGCLYLKSKAGQWIANAGRANALAEKRQLDLPNRQDLRDKARTILL